MEEIEAREAEWKPLQDFGSFWNARSQKHRKKQTPLEASQEKQSENARREKYAGIACVDHWLRRDKEHQAAMAQVRSERIKMRNDLVAQLEQTYAEERIACG